MDARDQEKAFEKLLARSLRQSLEPGGPDCPGPDILAAYTDRALSDAETSRWELHFSKCARCQQVLAAVEASRALPASAQPAGTETAAQDLRRVPPEHVGARLRYLSWRWLVPAVGVAAAVALWIAVRPAPHQVQAPIASQRPAEAPKEMAQNIEPTAPGAETKAAPSPRFPAGDSARAKARPETFAAKQAKREPQPSTVPERLERAAKAQSADAGPAAPPLAQPGAALAGRLAQADQQPAAQEKEKGKIPSAVLAQKAAPTGEGNLGKLAEAQAGPATAVSAPGRAAAKQSGGQQPTSADSKLMLRTNLAAAPTLVVIPSPSPSVIWRVGPAGTIERSRDAGRTWQAQVSNVTADLVAGSAPAETTCWVVGRAGTILRTTDGEHWAKVPAPAPADWIAVEARDALNAAVVAANHQRYATNDGGQTWRGPLTQ